MLEYGQWIKSDKLIEFFAMKATLAWSQKNEKGRLTFRRFNQEQWHHLQPQYRAKKKIIASMPMYTP